MHDPLALWASLQLASGKRLDQPWCSAPKHRKRTTGGRPDRLPYPFCLMER